MNRKHIKRKLIEQRIYGLAIIAVSIVFLLIVSAESSASGRDCGAVFLTMPLGLYLLFTRSIVLR